MSQSGTKYNRVFDTLVEELHSDRCVLFLGRHARHEAKKPDGVPVPTPRMLSRMLVQDGKLLEPGQEVNSSFSTEQVAQLYEAKMGRKGLLEFVRRQLEDAQPSQLYRLIWDLPFSAIYTTSYDCLVETSLQGAQRIQVINNEQDFVRVHRQLKRREIPYYKLHGSINADDVVITAEDQLKLELGTHNSMLFNELRRDIGMKTFLFVGCDLVDTDLLQVMISAYYNLYGKEAKPPLSFAVVNHPDRFLEAYWLQNFNIRMIDQDPDEFFAELVQCYKLINEQGATERFSTMLAERHPRIHQQLRKILDSSEFCGLAIYGQVKQEESKSEQDKVTTDSQIARLNREFINIPEEINEYVKQMQSSQTILVTLSIAELGAQTFVDRWRYVTLLRALAQQIDLQLDSGLLNRIGDRKTNEWRAETEKQLMEYWTDQLGADRIAEVQEIVKYGGTGGTPEQASESRNEYENTLAMMSSRPFFNSLRSVEGYRRLIIMITNFEVIEKDPPFFRRVTQYLLRPFAEDVRAGLILVRKASEPLALDRFFSAYSLELIQQEKIDL